MRTTTTFDQITWWSGRRRLTCRSCGKRFTRSRTFAQTLNPFNRNASGLIKTRYEIYNELRDEANSWQPDNQCRSCAAIPEVETQP